MFDDLAGVGKIDGVLKSVDNDKQHDEDEHIIKMSEQDRLNDPACNHVPQLDDDSIGDMVAVTCKNCPYGWFIPESEAIELGLK